MNNSEFIKRVSEYYINPDLASALALDKIVEAITYQIIANTAIMKNTTSAYAEKYLKIIEAYFTSSEIIIVRIDDENDEVVAYEITGDVNTDIVTAIKLLQRLANAYVENESFNYNYHGESYTGFSYEYDFHKYAVLYKLEF